MKIDVGIGHVTPAGANIFPELGFEPEEAARLKEESDREIGERDAIKETLRAEVTGWMRADRLKQGEAAAVLDITRPRVSDLVHGKLTKFSIDSTVAMVIRTGMRVAVVTS